MQIFFVIFHLLHLTAGAVGFRTGQYKHLAVYQNVTAAFSVWPVALIPELREEFWKNLCIVGGGDELNQALEKANRISDFFEIAELMCIDALDRSESCGCHFRIESQTPDGEAKRDDTHYCYSAAWEWKGVSQPPALHKEPLAFEYVPLSQRSYK